MTAIKNMLIGAGLLSAFLIVQSMDYEEEVRKEASIVENCNAMGKPAYRDPDTGRLRCDTNAPSYSFANPLKKASQ